MSSTKARFLVIAVTTVICLYGGEFFLGFLLVKSLLQRPRPPFSQQYQRASEYSVTYQYNNYGFRGDPVDLGRTYDLTLVGDSFFFGHGVSEEENLGYLLKQKGFQVLNASESASNPPQYYHRLEMLKNQRLKTKRIVFELYVGNDFAGLEGKGIDYLLNYKYPDRPLDYTPLDFLALERTRYSQAAFWRKFVTHEFWPHLFERKMKFYDSYSLFYAFGNAESAKAMDNPVHKYASQKEIDEAYDISSETIGKTVKIINAAQNIYGPEAEFYLLIIPPGRSVYGESMFRSMDELHHELAPSVRVIDMTRTMSPDMFYPNDKHWNAKGHEFASKTIMDYVAGTDVPPR